MVQFIFICICFFIFFYAIYGLVTDFEKDKKEENKENGSRHNDS